MPNLALIETKRIRVLADAVMKAEPKAVVKDVTEWTFFLNLAKHYDIWDTMQGNKHIGTNSQFTQARQCSEKLLQLLHWVGNAHEKEDVAEAVEAVEAVVCQTSRACPHLLPACAHPGQNLDKKENETKRRRDGKKWDSRKHYEGGTKG